MKDPLRVPCTYQGGKQRVAAQIVDRLLDAAPGPSSQFYDLCCGSAAISIELVNRGVDPSRIYMLDVSSWGCFWSAIGSGEFKIDVFDKYLADLPSDKREIKAHMAALSARPLIEHEAELYPLLQACSFGGKQIWRNGERWANACFRDYWEPTATSIRRSPANPMQPSPAELRRRISALTNGMKGVTCTKEDITTILSAPLHSDAVVYVDPPYQSTTGYAFRFDLASFIRRFRYMNHTPLFVSEAKPLNDTAQLLTFGGAKGGISGSRQVKHQEWLSRF
ncbi:DNA adenine methylase [Allorhizobium sp. BGMRC 0089]|uniref:DNA adenine methylase n=1 Tax=Allorhizobium sonneratiae TaxID=2934936 RepID=UPI0020333066|nr:DNA adenine methylase [Allorhizobium sonneratiae]MCM2291435.1 DNA adenine methylase [Allorhizobium sonneratiae]